MLLDLRYAEFMLELKDGTRFSRFKRFCQINFHIISYVKKLLIALILVVFSSDPMIQLLLILFVNIASAALILLTRPFIYKLLNFVRVLIELIAVMLVVMQIVLYRQDQDIQSQEKISETLVQ